MNVFQGEGGEGVLFVCKETVVNICKYVGWVQIQAEDRVPHV